MIVCGPPPTVRDGSVTRHGRKVSAILDDAPQGTLSLGAQRALAQIVVDHLGETLDHYASWTVVRFPTHRSALVTLWKD